jgi:hypothetical protein
MPNENEKIYDSPPSEPDDDFWLEQGKQMIEGSFEAVQEAAKALMTGLGLLQSIYLGILGFADYIPKTLSLPVKTIFLLPLVLWLLALHSCLQVMMTKRLDINLFSPDDIRSNYNQVLRDKQKHLKSGFWELTIGLIVAFLLLFFRFKL